MNILKKTLLAALIATTTMACVQNDPVSVGQNEDPETEAFRQGLIGADDIEMSFDAKDNTRSQALAGDLSMVGLLTADAVISTNIFLVRHLAIMRLITTYPATVSTQDSRIWQGDSEGLTYRVVVERKAAPNNGVRYDYMIAAKPEDAGEDAFLALIDGDVVRNKPLLPGRNGFGVVRFHFSNINTLAPEEEIGGIARIAFRKVGGVKQVHTRLLNVKTPDDPNFPKAAEYAYTNLPNGGGAMRWFSVGDVKGDGAPFEKVAVHSAWRADHSGVGAATVFDGSLEVDFWHVAECWDTNLLKGFERVEIPGMTHDSGDATTCFNSPDDLMAPDHMEEMADEDPSIPAAHPDEV